MENLLNETGWLIKIISIMAGALVIHIALNLLLKQIRHYAQTTTPRWNDVLMMAIQKPLQIFVWLIATSIIPYAVSNKWYTAWQHELASFRHIVLVIGVSWFLMRLLKFMERYYLDLGTEDGSTIDSTTLSAILNVCRIIVLVMTTLILMEMMGYNTSGLLAVGGVGGLAAGFAAKDLLSNIFGSAIIFLDKPFKIGDLICSADRSIEGNVTHVGWRVTTVLTLHKTPVYVPNSLFSTMSIENLSRINHRAIVATIGLRYSDFDVIEPVMADIRALLAGHAQIDTNEQYSVTFHHYGDSSLEFELQAFTMVTDRVAYLQLRQDILLQVGRIIAQHGAEIAFPTRSIYLQQTGSAA